MRRWSPCLSRHSRHGTTTYVTRKRGGGDAVQVVGRDGVHVVGGDGVHVFHAMVLLLVMNGPRLSRHSRHGTTTYATSKRGGGDGVHVVGGDGVHVFHAMALLLVMGSGHARAHARACRKSLF